jgi:hypothetical protein
VLQHTLLFSSGQTLIYKTFKYCKIIPAKMTGTRGLAWWVLKGAFFIVGSFVFSWIFWKTKEMVERKPRKRR